MKGLVVVQMWIGVYGARRLVVLCFSIVCRLTLSFESLCLRVALKFKICTFTVSFALHCRSNAGVHIHVDSGVYLLERHHSELRGPIGLSELH